MRTQGSRDPICTTNFFIASLSRVYVSSSAPQSARCVPQGVWEGGCGVSSQGGISYDQLTRTGEAEK
jgi:hypothetical protein